MLNHIIKIFFFKIFLIFYTIYKKLILQMI